MEVEAEARHRRPPIGTVLVVVPAHDEMERIGACLTSVVEAVDHLNERRPGVVALITVVLDRCRDATAEVVADFDVGVVPVEAGCVGAARRAGVRAGAARVPADCHSATLVVNTDADCVVPRTWLVDVVELADDHDLVLGEVEPDPAEMSPESLRAWWEAHPVGRGSLHGANLAVRLDAYMSAGEFPAVARQEDVLLVRALRACGAAVVGGTRVVTSARRQGRVEAGFAGYLRQLDAMLDLSPGSMLPGADLDVSPDPLSSHESATSTISSTSSSS